MKSWLGSDRASSRTLGLLIPHSVLHSLCFIFCENEVIEDKSKGGSPTKFKKHY